MASGYDPGNSSNASNKQRLSPKGAAPPQKSELWKRKPRARPSYHDDFVSQNEDVFENLEADEDEKLPPWESGRTRVSVQSNYRRGQSFEQTLDSRGFQNFDERSVLGRDTSGEGSDSPIWRNQTGRQGNDERSRRTYSDSYTSPTYRGSTNISSTPTTRYEGGDGPDRASWRNPQAFKERNQPERLEGFQESRGISRDFFRRPGKAASQTRSEGDSDLLSEDEAVQRCQDGPDASSWRNPKGSKDSQQYEPLGGQGSRSSTGVARDFFRRPGKSAVQTRFEESDDDEIEGEDLLYGYTGAYDTLANVSSDSNAMDTYTGDSSSQMRPASLRFPYRTRAVTRKTNAPYFSDLELESFLDEKAGDALLKLVEQKEKCQALFNAGEISETTLMLTLRVLSCMCYLDSVSEAVYRQELNMVLSMIESSLFLSKHLTRHLVDLSTQLSGDDDIKNLADDVDVMLKVLQLFLQHKSSGCSEVGIVLILLQKVVTSATLNNNDFDPQGCLMAEVEQVKECCNSLEEFQKTVKQRATEKPPPNNFRDIPIFPKSIELRQTAKPFLRKNIVRGRYDNVEHYLDVQYRLLREDFVAPLREGVTEFLANTSGRPQDIRVYYNVSIEGEKMGSNGIVHTLKFHLRGRTPERWESNKRLLYGSFVCLSRDDFKHISCATVQNRKIEDLEKGLVDVRFIPEAPRKCKGPFIMAESAAYFEAYRHVLQGLQQMNEGNLPFTRYIVHVASRMEPPAYLRGYDEFTYDLRPLLVDSDDQSYNCELQTKILVEAAYVPILEPESWPRAQDLCLDDSQKAALQTALTSEFAIIQGPPGTGKTYIGLKIIEVLLYNPPWNYNQPEEIETSPILVVCYTNHALDQFLEGIVKFGEQNVVRVGSRSSSEILKSKNITKLRGNRPHLYVEETKKRKQLKEQLSKTDQIIQRILPKLDLPRMAILDVMVLKDLMSPNHFKELSKQLQRNEQFNENPSANLLKWLEVGDSTNEKEEKVAVHDQDQKNSQESKAEDLIEVEDESAEIQRERQVDDDDDFHKDLEQHRQALKDECFRENVAYGSDCIIDSSSEAELHQSDAMTNQEESKVKRILHLKLCDRWRLYRLWVKRYKENHGEILSEHRQRYETLSKEMETLKAQEDLEILREASVIGMTTTGAARCRTVLQLLGPRIVVVEEAAEVLEAHIITTLTAKCQHLILIGDHQQLKPNPTVYRLAKLFNLDTSLFERMVNNGMPCRSLTHQHRMRPEISQLMKKHFYKKLQDDETMLNMDDIKGMQQNMFFVNHQRLEDGLDNNRTRSNQHEAEVVVELCRYLLHQGYETSQITVLTTYKGQLFCFKRLMDKSTFEGVRVCVVDNYQGEENDIILLSLVRSNEEGSIGFLRTPNRVCVALSRARMGFYCIGNATILKKAPIWQEIFATLEAEDRIGWTLPLMCQNHPNKITQVATANDFKEKVPCGGCDSPCGYMFQCGHSCHLICHPYDRRHKKNKCQKPCKRLCQRGDHVCPLKCNERCQPCQEKVEKLMSKCGHEIQVSCREFDSVSCPEPCPRLFNNCVHPCRNQCGQPCPQTCPERCEKTMQCGHTCTEPCGKPCATYCKVQVEKTSPKCGHNVLMDCSQSEVPCPKPCPKLFAICRHHCPKRCGQTCPETCPGKCEKALPCGHSCPKPCGEPCIWYCEVQVKRTLPDCGHNVSMDCSGNPDDVECQTSVTELRSICGHQLDILCFEEANSSECSERCKLTLKCGHQCPNVCGKPCEAPHVDRDMDAEDDLNVCEEIVEKSYSSCSHVIMLPCHKDVWLVPCSHTCSRLLACGHLCPKKCSESCPREKLESYLLWHFDKQGRDFSNFCRDKCETLLPCGHPCPNKCGEPCPGDILSVYRLSTLPARSFSTKCEELVEKTLPGCGHSAKAKCHQRVAYLPCSETCGKKLSCGHVCTNKCSEPCKCVRSVLKRLPKCEHSVQLPCCEDADAFKCVEKCQKELICGHQCPNKCGEPCPGEGDNSMTREEDESSHYLHHLNGETTPARQCTQLVIKTFLDCDHSDELPCYRDVSSVLCYKRCEQFLPCGHQCPNVCSDCLEDALSTEEASGMHQPPDTRCEESILKVLPCDHDQNVPCWFADSALACLEPCTDVLACGHTCRGNCDNCKQGAQHVTCGERCTRQLLCGHSCSGECGTPCPPDRMHCTRIPRTFARRRRHEPRILETFRCEHSLWNRQLKSKACILRCTRELVCKHVCIGVCGEPCPPFCPVCDRDDVVDKFPNKNIRPKETFIYLPDCDHLCETRFLDRMVANIQNPLKSGCIVIRSLLCPKCKEPIRNCSRYADVIRVIKTSIDAAKQKCGEERKALIRTTSSRYRTISWGDERATASISFAAGGWMKCPQGHVFRHKKDDDKQPEQKQEPMCPLCSR